MFGVGSLVPTPNPKLQTSNFAKISFAISGFHVMNQTTKIEKPEQG
jgi:hypothetical protein